MQMMRLFNEPEGRKYLIKQGVPESLVAQLDLGLPRGDVLIWYGVLYTITCQIAYLTPPFGYNLFLMRAFAPKEITMGDIYKSVWPFVLVMVATLALIMIFPDIALMIPNHFYPD